MSNQFCSFLSNGLFITDKRDAKSLNFSPCCRYQGGVNSLEKVNWKNISDWSPACSLCYVKEASNNSSPRLQNKDMNASFHNDELLYLDIDYSNACNAACSICTSKYSSSIARIERLENKTPSTPNIKQETFFNEIKSLNLDNLRVLKLIGGEPFYIDFHKKILKLIKNPENVQVLYQSNGSIYPDVEWWELASRFKSIELFFSIDAIGERFNYIRSNLDYLQVEDNILKIISDTRVNFKPGIHYTVNPLNAFYFDEIFNLLKKMKSYNSKTILDWDKANGQWALSNTTPILRNKIIKKYNNNRFSQLLNELPFDARSHANFVNSINLHEKRFNKNGLEIFPEIYEDAVKY
jgi:hypothetical protein